MHLSRRDFVKALGASALALSLPRLAGVKAGPLPPGGLPRPIFWGRALMIYVTIYRTPNIFAGHVGQVESHTVLPIYEVLEGENGTANSNIWYRTTGGYIHKTNVQPCQWRYNQPRKEIDPAGELVEITLPFIVARRAPNANSNQRFRLYYGTTYWAFSATTDDDGQIWYELRDDRKRETYYAPAEAFRFVTAADIAPLSPDVEDKRIELWLKSQRLVAYEGSLEVYNVLMSSGDVFVDAEGEVSDFSTPLGRYIINRKRPERRMADGDLASSETAFDLPGIPWVGYFNGGIAYHGCYWHNHYGRPMSHGCINLLPEDSLWVYRWTMPHVPLTTHSVEQVRGTIIDVLDI